MTDVIMKLTILLSYIQLGVVLILVGLGVLALLLLIKRLIWELTR